MSEGRVHIIVMGVDKWLPDVRKFVGGLDVDDLGLLRSISRSSTSPQASFISSDALGVGLWGAVPEKR
jgi:hypothetical protein